jgi:hypothetical protein
VETKHAAIANQLDVDLVAFGDADYLVLYGTGISIDIDLRHQGLQRFLDQSRSVLT